ncbi:MAG: DUF3996 domain-containing protein [Balneolales bacterium]|nr:DUF3996 domain-containing protein [Balneolales bacterium]
MKLSFHTITLSAILFMLVFMAAPQQAEAQNRGNNNFGIGVILGEPTGLSPKIWTSNTSAFAAGLAWSFSGSNHLHLHVDYQLHNFNFITVEKGNMGIYYGIGTRFQIRENSDDKIGIRFPLGLNYFFANDPVELFIEVAPILDLMPGTDFSANGGFGIRYYF